MRTLWASIAVALITAMLAGVSPGGAASDTPFGRFAVVCDFSHQNRSDPIVFPGERGVSHLHHFFGNRSTGPRSTPKSLRRTRRTTCNEPADRSGYWVPALIVRGEVIPPRRAIAYYITDGKDPRTVQAPPRGLRVVSGDASATMPQPRSVTTWRCVMGPLTDLFGGPTTEPVCGRGAVLNLAVSFPDCWDGRRLDSPDHRSHLAYATKASSQDTFTSCPASHPVPIPSINLEVSYPVNGAMPGGELSSGGVYSGHADFMDGWARGRLESLVAECLQRAFDCKG